MTFAKANRPSAAMAAAALLALAGCNGARVGPSPPAPMDAVTGITLQANYTAVDWDGNPGADGVVVRVYLFGPGSSLPITVRGTLDLAMYEGVISPDATGQARPFRTWRFGGKELEPMLAQGIAGWGYTIPLGWGQSAPTASSVTVTAQYASQAGAVVRAAAVTVPTRPK